MKPPQIVRLGSLERKALAALRRIDSDDDAFGFFCELAREIYGDARTDPTDRSGR